MIAHPENGAPRPSGKVETPMYFKDSRIALSSIASECSLDVRRDAEIAGVGKIPTELSGRLVPVTQPRHLAEALKTEGIAAIVAPGALENAVPATLGLVVSEAPAETAMRLHEWLCAQEGFHWTSFESRIDPTAIIAPGAYVASNDVVIGADCRIGPNAVIMPRSILGARCDIGPGVVVGGDAFEAFQGEGPARIVAQAGGVRIGNNVTVQAKSTLIRSAFACFTEVADEVLMDAQVHIAHDCRIGARTKIAACAELSGRVVTGAECFIGPNCSIANGVTLGEKSVVTLGAVVTRDVPAGERVSGNFALPHGKWLAMMRKIR